MALNAPPNLPNPAGGPALPQGFMASVRSKVFGQEDPAAAEAPTDPYALLTAAVALKLLQDTRKMCENGRDQFQRSWWKALLYIRGRQWIYWSDSAREFRDKRLYKWIPRPVTNITRTAWLSIRAMLSAIRLGIKARPMGASTQNIITADVASNLVQPLYDEHRMKAKVMPVADSWAIILGNAYLYVHWDPNDTTHMEEQSQWLCAMCGEQHLSAEIVAAQQKCPDCGSTELTEQPEKSMQPIGRGRTLAVSPLELLLPNYAQDFDDVDRLIYLVFRPRHAIEAEYPEDIVSRVVWTHGPTEKSLQLYRQLSTLADTVDSGAGVQDAQMGGGMSQIDGIVEQHLWMKPTKGYPEGVYLRFLGETQPIPVLTEGHRATIPFRRKKDQSPIWPWIHYPFELSPGSLYAEGALGPVCRKNEQINKLDSMAELQVNRMGNPIWLEPKGSNVERLTGEPGLVVRYDQVGANGAKPERVDGSPVNSSIPGLRQQHKEDAEELSGTYDVLKGGKAPGVDSYSGLELLVQRGQSRFESTFSMRAEALKKWFELALELERTYGPGRRTLAVMGPNQRWAFQMFENAQLDGDVAILVDDGSTTPRTALGRAAALERGVNMGLLNPSDPEREYKLLEEAGLTDLAPSLSADINSALQEQNATEEWLKNGMMGDCPLFRLPWQRDVVHLGENRKWMNSDAVREAMAAMTPEQQAFVIETFNAHLMEHQAGAQAEAMAQAMMMGGGAPPTPGSPTSGSPAGGGPQGGGPAPGGPGGRDGKGIGAGRALSNSQQNSGRNQSTRRLQG